MNTIPLLERFMKSISPEPNSGCWLWLGAVDRKGYGTISIATGGGKKRAAFAHRISHELFRGAIPTGMEIDHLCRLPCCVNPDHLEPVTHRENDLRGFGAPAMNARKTHCSSGHPFTPENTYYAGKGRHRRTCRTCKQVWSRKTYLKRCERTGKVRP